MWLVNRMPETNPFDTEEMAAGYAASRPPVHRRVLQQVYALLERDRPFRRALDIGCGAGVSTRALEGFAESSIGIEPVEAMVQRASKVAPFACFLAAAAEAIPLRDRSVDFMTAAGSLNYADLDRFFPEASRVLTGDGVLAVYDFSPGRSFRDGPALDRWFAEFCERYPWPRNEGRDLNPRILAEAGSGFRVSGHREFEIAIPMTRAFYVDYMLTETNVAAAVRRGTPLPEMREWCADRLAAVWNGAEREVLFRGYFVCMSAR